MGYTKTNRHSYNPRAYGKKCYGNRKTYSRPSQTQCKQVCHSPKTDGFQASSKPKIKLSKAGLQEASKRSGWAESSIQSQYKNFDIYFNEDGSDNRVIIINKSSNKAFIYDTNSCGQKTWVEINKSNYPEHYAAIQNLAKPQKKVIVQSNPRPEPVPMPEKSIRAETFSEAKPQAIPYDEVIAEPTSPKATTVDDKELVRKIVSGLKNQEPQHQANTDPFTSNESTIAGHHSKPKSNSRDFSLESFQSPQTKPARPKYGSSLLSVQPGQDIGNKDPFAK